MKTVTRYVFYAVSWPEDDRNDGPPTLFENNVDAKAAASCPMGWYGSTGRVYEVEKDSPDVSRYKSVVDWAKDKLTYNQMVKYGFIDPEL